MDYPALAARLKHMLTQKAEKIASYIRVLEKQKASVSDGKLDMLAAYAWMERNIIKELSLLQKVIEPLQQMYQEVKDIPAADKAKAAADRAEIERLEKTCGQLLNTARQRNGCNRASIGERMAALKKEIESLKIPKRKKSPYADIQDPSFIDIIT